jgi:hypothetical protein
MLRLFLGALALTLAASGAPAFEPKPPGSGETADLPAAVHMRNVGGSDGSGLCVFTSGQHAALFQNVTELKGFRKWMEGQPGGGYPQKWDAMVATYCKLKGVAVPQYIQHTGGDVEFLEKSLKTSRIVCITYAGHDTRYGNETIAHMVNLVFLDDTRAAILDNNFPGEMYWMTRKELEDRWRGVDAKGNDLVVRDRWGRGFPVGGGWAITFLQSPPTPHAPKVAAAWGDDEVSSAPRKCDCPNGCACPKGSDGCSCVREGQTVFGQCANGLCNRFPAPQVPQGVPVVVDASKDGWVSASDGAWKLYDRGTFKGQWDDRGWHEAAPGGAIFVETKPLPEGVNPPVSAFLTGVDAAKVPKAHKYHLNGRELPQHAAFSALTDSPVDDTARWHLAFVGDAKTLIAAKAKVDALPADLRAKLHVQYYDPAVWQAKELTTVVTLKAPTSNRFSRTVGSSDLLDDVVKLLSLPGGPLWVEPVVVPTPVIPDAPANPNAPNSPTPWVAIVAAVVAVYLWFKRKVVSK